VQHEFRRGGRVGQLDYLSRRRSQQRHRDREPDEKLSPAPCETNSIAALPICPASSSDGARHRHIRHSRGQFRSNTRACRQGSARRQRHHRFFNSARRNENTGQITHDGIVALPESSARWTCRFSALTTLTAASIFRPTRSRAVVQTGSPRNDYSRSIATRQPVDGSYRVNADHTRARRLFLQGRLDSSTKLRWYCERRHRAQIDDHAAVDRRLQRQDGWSAA